MARKPKPPRGDTGSIPAPTGLAAVVTDGHVVLTWNAVSNATSYWIWRNGLVLAIYTTPTFTDTSAASGYTYLYEVAAVVNSVLGPKCAGVSFTSLNLTYTGT